MGGCAGSKPYQADQGAGTGANAAQQSPSTNFTNAATQPAESAPAPAAKAAPAAAKTEKPAKVDLPAVKPPRGSARSSNLDIPDETMGSASPRGSVGNKEIEKGKLKKKNKNPSDNVVPVTAAAPCPEQRKREVYEDVFRKYDDDQSGEIDATELKAILEELKWDSSEEAVVEALKVLDGDGNGTIEIDEFLAWSRIAQNKLRECGDQTEQRSSSKRSSVKKVDTKFLESLPEKNQC